jgi:hypothetical protein
LEIKCVGEKMGINNKVKLFLKLCFNLKNFLGKNIYYWFMEERQNLEKHLEKKWCLGINKCD